MHVQVVPVLAVYASWAGLAGVIASLLLARAHATSAMIMSATFTTAAYIAWFILCSDRRGSAPRVAECRHYDVRSGRGGEARTLIFSAK